MSDDGPMRDHGICTFFAERWKSWLLRAIVVLLVLYPLSIGPSRLLAPAMHVRADDFTRFYYPIYWLSYECKLVDDVWGWYDDLWEFGGTEE